MHKNWFYWFGGWFFDFTKIITIVMIIVLLSHYFIATIIIVRGASMEGSYRTGDLVVIEKLSYLWENPKRGDVVGIYFPTYEQRRIIKRIVGLPKEKIEIKNGQVLINEVLLDEPYLSTGIKTIPDMVYTLRSDEYFVLGDNRERSSDSRVFGPLPKSSIIGKKLFYVINIEGAFPQLTAGP